MFTWLFRTRGRDGRSLGYDDIDFILRMSPQRFTSNVPHSYVLCIFLFLEQTNLFSLSLLLVHVFFSYLSSLFYHSLLIISLILYNWFC